MLRKIVQSGSLSLLLCGLYTLVMAALVPGFGTAENFSNVLFSVLPLFVVAVGQTIVLVTAGIDLSVTAVIALTSIVGGRLITSDGGWLSDWPLAALVAMVVMIVVGCLIGGLNGLCVAWLRMPPFIVTLTSMMFFSGLTLWWTQSRSISNLPSSFLVPGQNVWGTAAISLVVAVAVHFLLARTLFGLQLRAIGMNAETARVSGVSIERIQFLAYTACGGCAALGSIMIAGQLESCSPVQWENNLLDIIGATVIGGTSLYGGRGNVWWTASGALLLVLIDNSLNLLNLSYFTIMIAKGGVILLAALSDTLRHRFSPGGVP